MYMYIYIYIYVYTRTHTHTHTHALSLSLSLTHTHTHTQILEKTCNKAGMSRSRKLLHSKKGNDDNSTGYFFEIRFIKQPFTNCTLSAKETYLSRQHTATHCNTLQHTATHCNTLQHTATYAHFRFPSNLSLTTSVSKRSFTLSAKQPSLSAILKWHVLKWF